MKYIWIKGQRFTIDPYGDDPSEEIADRETVMEFERHDRNGDTAKWDSEVLNDSIWVVAEADIRLALKAQHRIEELYGIGAFAADAILGGGLTP